MKIHWSRPALWVAAGAATGAILLYAAAAGAEQRVTLCSDNPYATNPKSCMPSCHDDPKHCLKCRRKSLMGPASAGLWKQSCKDGFFVAPPAGADEDDCEGGWWYVCGTFDESRLTELRKHEQPDLHPNPLVRLRPPVSVPSKPSKRDAKDPDCTSGDMREVWQQGYDQVLSGNRFIIFVDSSATHHLDDKGNPIREREFDDRHRACSEHDPYDGKPRTGALSDRNLAMECCMQGAHKGLTGLRDVVWQHMSKSGAYKPTDPLRDCYAAFDRGRMEANRVCQRRAKAKTDKEAEESCDGVSIGSWHDLGCSSLGYAEEYASCLDHLHLLTEEAKKEFPKSFIDLKNLPNLDSREGYVPISQIHGSDASKAESGGQ